MRIEIADEIKFSHVAEGEYLVRLQDADQTVIGKLLRGDGGWKSYSIEQDGSWKGSFRSFGNTRYEASRALLEAYELANGLRDPEGRRVMKELETNLWYVAEYTGVRRSSRWADKADAIAKLASLQPLDFEQVGRQAALNDEPGAPISNADVRYALAGKKVGDPENMRILTAFQKGYQQVRDEQAAEALAEPKTGNEYAADAYAAFHLNHDAAAAIEIVRAAQQAVPEMAERWSKLLRTYRGLPVVPSGTPLDADGEVVPAKIPASEDELGVDDLEAFADGEDDEEDLFTVVGETVAEEVPTVTPVLVWLDGTVTGGVKELTDRLTGQAYGHETDEFTLYVTQGGMLLPATTRQLSQTSDQDSWIHEQYGIYAGDATEPVLMISLRIDGRA